MYIGSIARFMNASRFTRTLLDVILVLKFQRAQWAADRHRMLHNARDDPDWMEGLAISQRPPGETCKNDDASTGAARTRMNLRPTPKFRSLKPKEDEDERHREDDDEEDAHRSRSPKAVEKCGKGEIAVWVEWQDEWRYFVGPKRIVTLKELLHPDGAAVDVFDYQRTALPGELDHPLRGDLLIHAGRRLRAVLVRRAPARIYSPKPASQEGESSAELTGDRMVSDEDGSGWAAHHGKFIL